MKGASMRAMSGCGRGMSDAREWERETRLELLAE